jgi:iron complex transport system substrate-binding protein
MISLAGGSHVFPSFRGYLPMTPEGIVEAAPEVILTTTASVERLGGWDAVKEHPGIGHTPAAETDRIYAMDDLYLLGFGPRTGLAIADLARLLHPELAP